MHLYICPVGKTMLKDLDKVSGAYCKTCEMYKNKECKKWFKK